MRGKAVAVFVSLLALGGPRPAAASPTVLFEPATGMVLYAEDADLLWHPASLTKLMTAYLTFEALKEGKIALDTKLMTSELANAQSPSKIGLPVGGQISVDLALQALLIKSANDIAVILAEGVGGSHDAFIEKMNATAKRLGMTRTQFFNPNGLPNPGQITTARDLALLSQAIIKEFPEHQHLFSQSQFQIGRRRIPTHNGLLKTFSGADGMKTGFTCDSGYNVVGSASRGGIRLVAVVLGEPTGLSRSLRASSLMDHGFQSYQWKAKLGAPTLTTLPVETNAGQGPVSMRQFVVSGGCGGHRRAVVRKKRARSPAAAIAQAKATAGQPDGVTTPAADTPKAKAKGAVRAAHTASPQPKAEPQQ